MRLAALTTADGTPISRYRFAVILRRIVREHAQNVSASVRGDRENSTVAMDELPIHLWSKERTARWIYGRLSDEARTAVPMLETGRAGRFPSRPGPFRDLPPSHPAYPDVINLAQHGIFTGDEHRCFRGEDAVTERDLAASIHRLVLDVQRSGTPDWAEDAVMLFLRTEVPLSVLRTRSGRPTTRYEFARILHVQFRQAQQQELADFEKQRKRFLTEPDYLWDLPEHMKSPRNLVHWLNRELQALADTPTGPNLPCAPGRATRVSLDGGNPKFGLDVPNCHPDRDALVTLAQRGIFVGYADGSFRGDRPLTLGEYTVTLHRLAQDYQRQYSCRPVWQKPNFRKPPP